MKKIFIILAVILTFGVYSQEKMGYQTKNEIVNFVKSSDLIYIETSEPSKFSEEKIMTTGDNFVIIQTTANDYKEKFESLKQSFKNVEPILVYEDGIKQVCFDEIIIKTKSNLDDILKGIDYSFTANEFEKNQYLVQLNDYDTYKTFDLINTLFKDDRIEYVEPNFIKLNVLQAPPNNPLLSSQWSINNNGYLGGTVDADMDVDDAWAIATGTGIKVAIIDEGVQLNHPDLQANLLAGYDATGGTTNGGFENNDRHGTACAGIVGAVDNNGIGTVGVAYNSKIIPVRIGKYVANSSWTTEIWLANGINWAMQNGADVLSNSWGGGSVSATINSAINNAVTTGRGGKGCVVVFAAGNNNSIVSNPATNPNVIAVAATSQCDQRKSPTSCDGENYWGSNFGTNLDVGAPGVKIYTSDLTGTLGYETGDYTSTFNGTSSACPNVAGVVALILSLKPSLTGVQARQVLEQNTDKVGGYSYTAGVAGQPNGTWSNDLGYGRINAFKALQSIAPPLNFTGANVICGNTTLNLSNYNSNNTITWTCTPNLTIVSSNNMSITVAPTSISISAEGTVTATTAFGQVYTKKVWIGKPNFEILMNQEINSSYINLFIGGNNINNQGITSTTWTKTASVGNPIAYGTGFTGFAKGIGYNWSATMTVTATNICGTTSITKVIVPILGYNPAKMSNQSNSKIFYITPNPSKYFVNIEVRNQENIVEKDVRISGELFDMMGLSRSKVEIIDNKASFSVEGLKKGIYILKIYINDQVETHQIAVE